MTMPLVSETPESAAEPWRNNLRGELHTELTGLRSEEWWTGRKLAGLPRSPAGRYADFVAVAASGKLHPPADLGIAANHSQFRSLHWLCGASDGR